MSEAGANRLVLRGLGGWDLELCSLVGCVCVWGGCASSEHSPCFLNRESTFLYHSIADSNSSSLLCHSLSALGGRCGPEPTPLTSPLDLCGVQRATCQYLQACTLGTVSRLQRNPELRKANWPKVTSVPGSRVQVF